MKQVKYYTLYYLYVNIISLIEKKGSLIDKNASESSANKFFFQEMLFKQRYFEY